MGSRLPHDSVSHVLQAAELEQPVRSLVAEGHLEGIFGVAFSPDGKHLASGGDEGEIVIWDTATWREVRKLEADPSGSKGHREDVWGLGFSPDSRLLASASHDETVRIWEVDTGKPRLVLKGHSFHVWGVAFSPDGKRLASAGGTSDENGRFSAGELKVWEAATGRAILNLKVPAFRAYDVAFSPDGKRLASAWEDKTVKVWDVATGQELFALTGHRGEVNVVAWSPDGMRLASGSADKTVRLWDVATRQQIRTFAGHHGVAFSGDGKLLVTGGAEGVVLRDAANGNELRSLKRGLTFTRLAISPNGKQVVWDSDIRTIHVWTPPD
jgi:WD40 repeat protein